MTVKLVGALLLSSVALAAVQNPSAAPLPPGQATAPGANNPDPKTVSIVRGRILLANGRALRRATVRLTPASCASGQSGCFPTSVASNLEGRYEFTNVTPGDYQLSASKSGYLTVELGQQRALGRGTAITVEAGRTIDRLDMTLQPGATMSGRVTDQNGDPVEGIIVRLMQPRFEMNRRTIVPVGDGYSGVTNDEGRYHFYAVPPGQYILRAAIETLSRTEPPSILPPGYTTTYYPGTTIPSDARYVRVAASPVADIDLPLARVPIARVSGTVVNSAGEATASSAELSPVYRAGDLPGDLLLGSGRADGGFEFRSVPAGEWVLRVTSRAAPRAPLTPGAGVPSATSQLLGESGLVRISVNGVDLSGLRVRTETGSTVRGRVVFEPVNGQSAFVSRPPGVSVRSIPIDLDDQVGAVERYPSPEVGFILDNLYGRRRLMVQSPPPWSVKVIRVGGKDISDEVLPFGTAQQSLTDVEVVLTDGAARVTGNVADARGRPTTGYTAIVFATDSERWYYGSRFLKFARPKQDGTFTIAGLPSGEYYVAAVDSMDGNDHSGEWLDPEFLESIAIRSSRVTLSDGQQLVVNPRLVVR